MPIAYRTLLPSEEDMLFDLRSQVLDTPREICTQLFTDFGTDAQCHDHTLVAVDETGAVIATAGYWLRMIRGIDGRPQRTGHLYGVATRPDKRGQHHAGRLLSLAIEKMQQDGCVWSVLGAREAARPLYERNGWKSYASPFRSVITAIDPSKGAAAYTTEQISPDQLDSRWEDIAAIYSAFNWERPLTLLRTEAYWKGYVGWMLRDWMEHYQARLFLASHAETREPCAYAVAHIYDPDYAQKSFGSPPWFSVGELGVIPHQVEALAPMIDAIIVEAAQSYASGYSQWIVPQTSEVDEVLNHLGAGAVQIESGHDSLMARPIAPTVTSDDLDVLFATPGGIFWHMDQY